MDTKRIDELLIKVSGRVPTDKKIELGQDVMLVIVGTCVKQETTDNQDGSVNMCFVIKPTQAIQKET